MHKKRKNILFYYMSSFFYKNPNIEQYKMHHQKYGTKRPYTRENYEPLPSTTPKNLQYLLDNPIDISNEKSWTTSKPKLDPIEYDNSVYVLTSNEYRNKIRLLTSNDLSRINEGIYCWIIGYDENRKPQLFFKETFSHHEIDTKHHIIVKEAKVYRHDKLLNSHRTNSNNGYTSNNEHKKTRGSTHKYLNQKLAHSSNSTLDEFGVKPIKSLLFAGEFMFKDGKLIINIGSGTFMTGRIDPVYVPLDVQDYLKQIFKTRLKRLEVNVSMNNVKAIRTNNNDVQYSSLIKPSSFDKRRVIERLLGLGINLLKFRNMQEYEKYSRKLKNFNGIRSINNNYTVSRPNQELRQKSTSTKKSRPSLFSFSSYENESNERANERANENARPPRLSFGENEENNGEGFLRRSPSSPSSPSSNENFLRIPQRVSYREMNKNAKRSRSNTPRRGLFQNENENE